VISLGIKPFFPCLNQKNEMIFAICWRMDCISNIQKLAWAKLKEAECLLEKNHWDGAYYTAGYTIELMLKARICKTFGIENFYDENSGILKQLKFPQTFKSHDFEQLLLLSGVYTGLKKVILSDLGLQAQWSSVCEWSEEVRYSYGKTLQEVEKFLVSVLGIALWIEKQL
jgi:hypothetical protein